MSMFVQAQRSAVNETIYPKPSTLFYECIHFQSDKKLPNSARRCARFKHDILLKRNNVEERWSYFWTHVVAHTGSYADIRCKDPKCLKDKCSTSHLAENHRDYKRLDRNRLKMTNVCIKRQSRVHLSNTDFMSSLISYTWISNYLTLDKPMDSLLTWHLGVLHCIMSI